MPEACEECGGREGPCSVCSPPMQRPPEPVKPGCQQCRVKDEQIGSLLRVMERMVTPAPVLEEVHPLPGTQVLGITQGSPVARELPWPDDTFRALAESMLRGDLADPSSIGAAFVHAMRLGWNEALIAIEREAPGLLLTADLDMRRGEMLVEPADQTQMTPQEGDLWIGGDIDRERRAFLALLDGWQVQGGSATELLRQLRRAVDAGDHLLALERQEAGLTKPEAPADD